MRYKKRSLACAVTLGAVISAGVYTVSDMSSHPGSAHARLASYAAFTPTIDINNCPTLDPGYRGGCVNQLQFELDHLDDAGVPVDGVFGPATRRAVMQFQDANDLAADGLAGPQTKAALHDDIAELQTGLNGDEDTDRPVDGIFSPGTVQAVMQFQEANGLPLDGIMGPQTKAAFLSNSSVPTPELPSPPGTDQPAQSSNPQHVTPEDHGDIHPDEDILKELKEFFDKLPGGPEGDVPVEVAP